MIARRLLLSLGLLILGMVCLVLVSKNLFGTHIFLPAAEHPLPFFACGVFACISGYVLLLRVPSHTIQIRPALLVLGAVLITAPLFFVLEVSNSDAAFYFFLGDMQHKGGNPYTETSFAPYASSVYLQQFQEEVGVSYFLPTAYGPLWTLGMKGLLAFSGASFALAALFLRALYLLLLLAVLLVLIRAKVRSKTVLLFAWNPFVLLFGFANLHNDFLICLALIGSLLAFRRERWMLAIALLIVSAAIKWVTILLLPLLVVAMMQRAPRNQRLQKTGGVVILLIISTGLLWAPYGFTTNLAAGAPTQIGYKNFTIFQSQADILTTPQTELFRTEEAKGAVGFFRSHHSSLPRVAGVAAFCCIYVFSVLRLVQRRWQYEEAALTALFSFVILALSWYVYWYWLWLIPFLVIGRGVRAIGALSLVPFFAGLNDLQLAPLSVLVVYMVLFFYRTITAHIHPTASATTS